MKRFVTTVALCLLVAAKVHAGHITVWAESMYHWPPGGSGCTANAGTAGNTIVPSVKCTLADGGGFFEAAVTFPPDAGPDWTFSATYYARRDPNDPNTPRQCHYQIWPSVVKPDTGKNASMDLRGGYADIAATNVHNQASQYHMFKTSSATVTVQNRTASEDPNDPVNCTAGGECQLQQTYMYIVNKMDDGDNAYECMLRTIEIDY